MRRNTIRQIPVALALLTSVFASPAAAQNWTGIFDTSWNHGFNWDTLNAPNSATAVATFGNAVVGPINIDTSVQAQSLIFGNSFGSYTITSSAGQTLGGLMTLTVGAGVTTPQAINLAYNSACNLLVPSGSSLNITNDAAASQTPTLSIANGTVIGTPGNGGVIVSGAGTTAISDGFASGPTAVTGGVTVNGPGLLQLIGNNSATLSGAHNNGFSVTLNGGTLATDSDAALGIPTFGLQLNANSATAGGLLLLGDGAKIVRPISLVSPTRVIATGANEDFVTGPISGPGQLVKDGTGTLTLSNSGSTFSGGTIVNAGVLAIIDGAALGTGTVTLNGTELRGTRAGTGGGYDLSVSNPISVAPNSTATFSISQYGRFIILAPLISFPANTNIQIGSPGNPGEVIWDTPTANEFNATPTVAISSTVTDSKKAQENRTQGRITWKHPFSSVPTYIAPHQEPVDSGFPASNSLAAQTAT